MLAVLMCASGVFLVLISTGSRLSSGLDRSLPLPWRTFSLAVAFLLLVIAMRVYIGRIELLLEDHTVFAGVTYSDAHVILGGMLAVCCALILGAGIAAPNTSPGAPRDGPRVPVAHVQHLSFTGPAKALR